MGEVRIPKMIKTLTSEEAYVHGYNDGYNSNESRVKIHHQFIEVNESY